MGKKIAVFLLCLLLIGSMTVYGSYLSFRNHTPKQSTLPAVHSQPAEELPLRQAGRYHFLLLGRDRASLCTDVILLCTLDTEAHSLFCLQLPRDTYFRYEGTTHLNAVFAQHLLQGAEEADALRGTADAIGTALGVPIDYTALLYLDSFVEMVDAIGGVPIDIPFDMDCGDPSQEFSIHLAKGPQVLSGAQAEQFVRFRKTHIVGKEGYAMGDLGRVQAQKLFLSALFAKCKTLTFPKLLALLPKALESTKCDCSLKDTAYFVKQALTLDADRVTFQTLPGWVASSAYIMSRPDTYALCKEYVFDTDTPVLEKNFDTELHFCNLEDADIVARYYGKGLDNRSYSAKDLQENGLTGRDLYLKKYQ